MNGAPQSGPDAVANLEAKVDAQVNGADGSADVNGHPQ